MSKQHIPANPNQIHLINREILVTEKFTQSAPQGLITTEKTAKLCMIETEDDTIHLAVIGEEISPGKYPARLIPKLPESQIFWTEDIESTWDLVQERPMPEKIRFPSDLMHFYMLYTLKADDISLRNWCGFTLVSFVTLAFQMLCLCALSYSYVFHWGQQYVTETHYFADESDFNLSVVINGTEYAVNGMIEPIGMEKRPEEYENYLPQLDENHFGSVYIWSALAGFFVLFCRLLQSTSSLVNSWSAHLFYQHQGSFKKNHSFFVSLLLVALNVALIFCTWVFACYIIFYGGFFGILGTSDIVIAPIGAVFVLEIDSWVYHWFFSRYVTKKAFWSVQVEATHNRVSDICFKLCVGLFVLFVPAWWLVHNSVYSQDAIGIGFLFSLYLGIAVICVVAAAASLWPWNREFWGNIGVSMLSVLTVVLMAYFNYTWRTETLESSARNWMHDIYDAYDINMDRAKDCSVTIEWLCYIAFVFCLVDFVAFVFRGKTLFKKLLTISAQIAVYFCVFLYVFVAMGFPADHKLKLWKPFLLFAEVLLPAIVIVLSVCLSLGQSKMKVETTEITAPPSPTAPPTPPRQTSSVSSVSPASPPRQTSSVSSEASVIQKQPELHLSLSTQF